MAAALHIASEALQASGARAGRCRGPALQQAWQQGWPLRRWAASAAEAAAEEPDDGQEVVLTPAAQQVGPAHHAGWSSVAPWRLQRCALLSIEATETVVRSNCAPSSPAPRRVSPCCG